MSYFDWFILRRVVVFILIGGGRHIFHVVQLDVFSIKVQSSSKFVDFYKICLF